MGKFVRRSIVTSSFLLIAVLSVDASIAKGRSPQSTSSASGSASVGSAELASTHRPLISVVRAVDGLVVVDVVTPLQGTGSHYIQSHAILDEDKNTIIYNKFDIGLREKISSNYKFKNLSGKYHIESKCNLHGSWIEAFEFRD